MIDYSKKNLEYLREYTVLSLHQDSKLLDEIVALEIAHKEIEKVEHCNIPRDYTPAYISEYNDRYYRFQKRLKPLWEERNKNLHEEEMNLDEYCDMVIANNMEVLKKPLAVRINKVLKLKKYY